MGVLRAITAAVLMLTGVGAAWAQGGAASVLWYTTGYQERQVRNSHRQAMADFLTGYGGGGVFDVTFDARARGGDLARALAAGTYDIVVLDVTDRGQRLNAADTEALQRFYAAGRRGIMLDGSLWIRNVEYSSQTRFPGPNGAMAGLLVNQITVLAQAGGGVLIGVDHEGFQSSGNRALQALVPEARFFGTTNPSTDGDFIGDALLGRRESVTARDVLVHWESVPNQGEAPVGTFTDFMGNPIEFFSLVETADKRGDGRKRPYISANIFPGTGKVAIDSDEPVFDNIPTHKSGATRP